MDNRMAEMSNSTTPEAGHVSAAQVVQAAILSLVAFSAFFGNISLCIIIGREKHLRTASNLLILSLSAADLMVSVVNMPIIVYTIIVVKWPFSQAACTALGFTTMLTFVASVMNLGTISINRYINICHQAKFKTLYTFRNSIFFIIGTWGLSVALSSPPLLGWCRYGYISSQFFCFAYWKESVSYTYFMVAICFGGPCSVMTYCYAKILKEHRRSLLRIGVDPVGSTMTNSNKRRRFSLTKKPKQPTDPTASAMTTWREQRALRRRKEDFRLTVSIFIVICCFVVCWLPFCISMFIWVHSRSASKSFSIATLILGCSNSAVNPVVYGVMNRRFQQGYIKLFCCFRKTLIVNSNSAEDSAGGGSKNNPSSSSNHNTPHRQTSTPSGLSGAPQDVYADPSRSSNSFQTAQPLVTAVGNPNDQGQQHTYPI